MNASERRAAKLLESQGWKVFRGGWPDFLCVRDGKVKAVEVKMADAIKLHQQENHRILRLAGLKVEVLSLEHKKSKHYESFSTILDPESAEWIIGLAKQNRRSISRTLALVIEQEIPKYIARKALENV